jgi:hypothetical protein
VTPFINGPVRTRHLLLISFYQSEKKGKSFFNLTQSPRAYIALRPVYPLHSGMFAETPGTFGAKWGGGWEGSSVTVHATSCREEGKGGNPPGRGQKGFLGCRILQFCGSCFESEHLQGEVLGLCILNQVIMVSL